MDIKDGKTVKGVNFINLKTLGDPVELAQKYAEQGADELVFLDITATVENRKTLTGLVQRLSESINIPFTIGGGIRSLEDAKRILDAGAQKISIGSAALARPELISEIAQEFGSSRVVVAIDVKQDWVYTKGGREKTDWKAVDWAKKAQEMGAGELLVTVMDKDGTKDGFAIPLYRTMSLAVQIPIIASGGAGKTADFVTLFKETDVSAGLAASIFHYGEVAIPTLKKTLKEHKIPVA